MKLPYKPLPAIAPNNVTLLLGESIGTNIDASLSHAKEILSQRNLSGSVLYINTVQNTRSMNESARKHGLDPNDNGLCIIDPRHNIYLLTIDRGDLYRWRNEIKEYLSCGYIQYVIINSWEFAGKNSRYREEAVFLFKELTNGLEGGHPPVNLLVYAEDTEREISAQKIRHSGFGKLAGIVRRVENITVKQQFEETSEVRSLMSEVGKSSADFQSASEVAEFSGTDSQSVSEVTEAFNEIRASYETLDPLIGTEDEPGIDGDEALRRFLARVKPAAKREWDELKKPIRRAIDVASEKDKHELSEANISEIQNSGADSQSASETAEVISPNSEAREEATSDMEVHFAPVFVPTSDIGRRTSDFPREPIHLNNHKPDKAPTQSYNRTNLGHRTSDSGLSPNVHSDIIKK